MRHWPVAFTPLEKMVFTFGGGLASLMRAILPPSRGSNAGWPHFPQQSDDARITLFLKFDWEFDALRSGVDFYLKIAVCAALVTIWDEAFSRRTIGCRRNFPT